MAKSRTDRVRDLGRQMLVIDTCVLVDSLRGYAPARAWLAGVASRYDLIVAHSVITVAEVYAGVSSEDSVAPVRDLLSMMRPLPVDESIAERAGGYLGQWGRSRGLRMPDALIAATAAVEHATLVTRDISRFPMSDIAVTVPY